MCACTKGSVLNSCSFPTWRICSLLPALRQHEQQVLLVGNTNSSATADTSFGVKGRLVLAVSSIPQNELGAGSWSITLLHLGFASFCSQL